MTRACTAAPTLAAVYLLLRLLIPVLLIVLASRGATPAQRIGLVRDYLLAVPTPASPLPTASSDALVADPDECSAPALGDSN